MGIAGNIIIIVCAGLVFGFIAVRLKLPPVLGYILAGVLIGPHTGIMTDSDLHSIELLSEIGVALLLFAIGLELSFRELREVRKIALIGTPIQIVLTGIFGYGMGLFLGMESGPAILLGAVVSLSSTMIAIKTLSNRGLMGTLSSRVMLGMLIIQDIAAIPMIVLIPQLRNLEGGLLEMALILGQIILFIAVMIFMGRKVLPAVFGYVARIGSREIFILFIAALGLGIGFLAYQMGLSLAFGAFTAGIVLSESEYSHQALSDIVPLRDLFGLLFFVSIGMLLDPAYLIQHVGLVAVLIGSVMAVKFLVFLVLSRIFGYINIVPLAVGFGLAQVGEFSFVLARVGLSEGLITEERYSLILALAVISMFLTPFLTMLTGPLYNLFRRFKPRKDPFAMANPVSGDLNDHVVIAGSGRVGMTVAGILQDLGYPFILVEYDYHRYSDASDTGFPIIYGDASQEEVLEAANLAGARLVIITTPALVTARLIMNIANHVNPGVDVIARTEGIRERDELYKSGVYEVVQPEFEAGLEIIRQALLHYEVSVTAIQNYLDAMRREAMVSSPGVEKEDMVSRLRGFASMLEMEWFEIGEGSPLVDRTIGESNIRSQTGATVVIIARKGSLIHNPEVTEKVRVGDMISVIGTASARRMFREYAKGVNPPQMP